MGETVGLIGIQNLLDDSERDLIGFGMGGFWWAECGEGEMRFKDVEKGIVPYTSVQKVIYVRKSILILR